MVEVTQRYPVLRRHLDELGYHQTLPVDAVNLVDKLVADLLQTTDSLKHYKQVAKEVSEERDALLLGCEPYKCDNAKLVQECNKLHLEFLKYKEQAEFTQLNLNRRIRSLETQLADLESDKRTLKGKVRELELINAEKTGEIYKLTGLSNTKHTGKKTRPPSRPSSKQPLACTDSAISLEKGCASSDQLSVAMSRCDKLTREVQQLVESKRQQLELLDTFKNQIENRDKEIIRLNNMLKGGRPRQAINKECCYKDVMDLNTKLNSITSDKNKLEAHLKESIDKQHEAMKRCLQLADRNKELEKELKDIDNMALAVEQQCNDTVIQKQQTLAALQNRLEKSIRKVQDLEQQMLSVKCHNQELTCDLEAAKNEKRNLKNQLDNLDEDNKRFREKSCIAHELNLEIERLAVNNKLQKQRIMELENRVLRTAGISSINRINEENIEDIPEQSTTAARNIPRHIKRKVKKSGYTKINDPSKIVLKLKSIPKSKDTVAKNVILSDIQSEQPIQQSESSRYMMDKGRQNEGDRVVGMGRQAQHCTACHSNPSKGGQDMLPQIERLQSERDYYYKEYARLRDRQQHYDFLPDKISVVSKSPELNTNSDLRRRLKEKEAQLSSVLYENHNMDYNGQNVKAIINRLERERDLAKGDAMRLEAERDTLRSRLKIATETQLSEHARLEKAIFENETRVRTLESERRELMTNQGSRRATINNLEEQCNALKDQLKIYQTDLSHNRSIYSQLKMLQEQTDRALCQSQAQLVQSENELAHAQERLKESDKNKDEAAEELNGLRIDVDALRKAVSKMAAEKQSLLMEMDVKTEKLAKLEYDYKDKDSRVGTMEDTLADLKRKLRISIDQTAARDQTIFSLTKELEGLRKEIGTVARVKENLMAENSRLQDDLSSVTVEFRNTIRDLEASKQEAENLKLQLQQYCTEVQHVEELMSRKDLERSEMLEQFRSLSHEATVLESNNHSLESEAQDTKMQLRMATDKVSDLLQQIETKDAMIHGCEMQIADLTAHIAALETETTLQKEQLRNTEYELGHAKQLCVKLDAQKDTILQEAGEKNAAKDYVESELAHLRTEHSSLQSTLTREKANIETLEGLLTSSREEAVQNRLLSQEMSSEVARLRVKIDNLQSKLDNEQEQVRRYQTQINEYNLQVQELRREMTNERFNSARANEEKRALQYQYSQSAHYLTSKSGMRNLFITPPHPFSPSSRSSRIGCSSILKISIDQTAARDQTIFSLTKELEGLRKEIGTVARVKENLMAENSRLQDDLSSVTVEFRNTIRDLEASKQEAENLKLQLQQYCTEVQHVEELMSRKDLERSEMLEQFRSLSHEATVLESNNHSLESEAQDTKMQLRMATDKVSDLLQQIETKDAMIHGCEMQIADLTAHIAALETETTLQKEQLRNTEYELGHAKQLCVKLDAQKDTILQEAGEKNAAKDYVESELAHLRTEHSSLQSTLTREKANIETLEGLLTSSREEAVQNRLLSQEMSSEVARLRVKIDNLQSKLDNEQEQVRRYQTQINEYNLQVQELRREMTNERFNSARANEEKRALQYQYSQSAHYLTSKSGMRNLFITPPHPFSPSSRSSRIGCSSILNSQEADKLKEPAERGEGSTLIIEEVKCDCTVNPEKKKLSGGVNIYELHVAKQNEFENDNDYSISKKNHFK